MQKKSKFIIMRHSQAIHNQFKNIIKNQNLFNQIQQQQNKYDKQKYKKSTEYLHLKYNQDFIDRTQINIKQIKQIQKLIDFNQIGLIIISPMNRCILTALYLFDDYKKQKPNKNLEIIVEPLLTSRITSAWSIGKSLKEKKQNYPQLNYSFCKEEIYHWCFEILQKDGNHFNQFLKQQNPQINLKQPEIKLNRVQNLKNEEILLKYIKQQKGQSYQSVINRSNLFKKKLKQIYMNMTDKKILIISHQNILKILTAHSIDEKGKAKSDMNFNHMELIYCTEQLFYNNFSDQTNQSSK